MEEVRTIDCYQCRIDHKDSPTEIKQAFSGPLFPFCSQECKDKYGIENFGQIKNTEHKFHSIEECQKRIMQWKEEKYGKKIEPVQEEGKDIYDVAKMIFG